MSVEGPYVYLEPGEYPYHAIVEAGLGIIHAFVDSDQPFAAETVNNQFKIWSSANTKNGVNIELSIRTTDEIMVYVREAILSRPISLHELASTLKIRLSQGGSSVNLRTGFNQADRTIISILDIISAQIDGVDVSRDDIQNYENQATKLLTQLISRYQG